MREKERDKRADASEQNKTASNKFAVMVRPKQNQNSSDTIKALNRKCNPNDLNLNNVTKTKNGLVIIECTSNEQQNVIKSRIENAIGDDYEVSSKLPLQPKIKIFGITEAMQTSELEALLKRQNDFIAQGDIQVLKVIKDWKNEELYNAIVQVDKSSFKRLMNKKKVLVFWDSCVIKEHYSIVRCHHCNHLKGECRNKKACGYCGKEHDSNQCDEEAVSCINCAVANEKYALNLNINHNVWSKKCEILKRKLERVSKRTEYNE